MKGVAVAGLTEEQRGQFETDGFVVLPSLFSKREIAQMAAEAGRLAQWQVAISLALGEVAPRLVVERTRRNVVLRTMRPVLDVSPVFSMYSCDERLVRPLRQVMGCEPVLFQEALEYIQTLPGEPTLDAAAPKESFEFHVDLPAFLADGYPRETVSSAIVIDEVTADNGPLRVVPGSHRHDGVDSGAASSSAVPLVAPAGSVVLLDAALVHAVTPNTSGQPRRVLVFSHHPETEDIEYDKRCGPLREAGQAAEDRYAELVYSGAAVPEYRLA